MKRNKSYFSILCPSLEDMLWRLSSLVLLNQSRTETLPNLTSAHFKYCFSWEGRQGRYDLRFWTETKSAMGIPKVQLTCPKTKQKGGRIMWDHWIEQRLGYQCDLSKSSLKRKQINLLYRHDFIYHRVDLWPYIIGVTFDQVNWRTCAIKGFSEE